MNNFYWIAKVEYLRTCSCIKPCPCCKGLAKMVPSKPSYLPHSQAPPTFCHFHYRKVWENEASKLPIDFPLNMDFLVGLIILFNLFWDYFWNYSWAQMSSTADFSCVWIFQISYTMMSLHVAVSLQVAVHFQIACAAFSGFRIYMLHRRL